METSLYFSFGMNMAEDTMPYFKRVGPGHLYDYKLVFNFYANIEEAPGYVVAGVLWEIQNEWQLDYLDKREGYIPNRKDNLYDRIVVDVWQEDIKKKAYVYKMAGIHRIYADPIPQYIQWMIDGRKSVGLPIDDLVWMK